ncbi:hypothetical protein BDP27DRAFT_1318437 [Rhodocollybia butyracea]|uniref:J domain-containing protein n=1 Tax=Rhodocollybia butyracea TaxID=206335 RepID=A0A9P5UBX4_9AGAR|nr:hypothetical protein BDP27DRAFT_1318437 [Rhodocollybia butyracea]
MISSLLQIAGWRILPKAVTEYSLKIILQLYSQYTHRPPPARGSPAYVQLYRYTYATIILAYLIYTLIQGSSNLALNFYEILGVSPSVDENGLKSAFKQFAKRFHPDRAGPQYQDLFMETRDVFEALKNPTVRFAYDRFGPDVLEWSHLSTPREYLHHGLLQSSGYQLVTAVVLFLFSAIGRPSPAKFWRYILFIVFFALELAYILHPSPSPDSIFSSSFWDPANTGARPTLLHIMFPHRTAFQHIMFLHQVFIILSVALTQIAPQLFPDDQQRNDPKILEQISKLAVQSDAEASLLLHTDLQSLHPTVPRISTSRMRPMLQPSSDVIDQLTTELKNMIIETTVRQQKPGPLQSACEHAIVRSRTRSEASARLLIPANNGNRHLPSPSSAYEGEGKLPSPRPSPPPPLIRKNSSYVRARSVSWS